MRRTLFVDSKDRVWIDQEPGLIFIQPDSKSFEYIIKKAGKYGVVCFLEDNYQNIWIGKSGSSLVLLKNDQIVPYLSDEDIKRIPVILDLHLDRFNNLWIAAYDSGLFKIVYDKLVKQNIKSLDSNTIFHSVDEDKYGRLLVGTEKGIIMFDDDSNEQLITKKDGLCDNYVRDILTDSKGNTFVCSKSGLNRIQFKQNGSFNIEKTMEKISINSLFEDQEGSIWISTYDEGLKRLRDPLAENISLDRGLMSSTVSIFKDQDQIIWAGSHLGELFKYEAGRFSLYSKLKSSLGFEITAIGEDKNGKKIIGTVFQGIYLLEQKLLIHVPGSAPFFNGGVYFIFCDSKNNIWLGSGWGLFRLIDGQIQKFSAGNDWKDNPIQNMYEKNGELWLCSNVGIIVLKNEKVDRIIARNYAISSLVETEQDVYFVGTRRSGILRIKGGKISKIGKTQGIISVNIAGMTYDKDGYLWLSSDRGIQRLSIIQLHQVADRNNMKVGGVRIGVSDGLLSDRCIDFEKNGILIPKKDTIWFATNRGIAEVKTQQLNINNTPPGVLINEVRINSKKVPFSREVRVFHDSQHISFSFSINTFISQENAHIKYRLYGYEDTWKELQRSDQRQVTYFNLPDGSYEFKVIASNSHGVWNRSGDKREFIIKTSFVKKKSIYYPFICNNIWLNYYQYFIPEKIQIL